MADTDYTSDGGLKALAPSQLTTDSTAVPGTSTINIGGQKISTKGPVQGGELLKAMEEEYARRVPDNFLGRFNSVVEGLKDAVAATSKDPGSAMAARDQEKRLQQESLFQMRSQMAALRGQMMQQENTNKYMTGAGAGTAAAPQAGAPQGGQPAPQAGDQAGAPQAGGSPSDLLVNSLPPQLQGYGQLLASQGDWPTLAKMAQDTHIHKTDLQKQMEYVQSLPPGPERTRVERQVLEKTFGTYEYVNDKGETTRYTLGGPNDPYLSKTAASQGAPAAGMPTPQGAAVPAPQGVPGAAMPASQGVPNAAMPAPQGAGAPTPVPQGAARPAPIAAVPSANAAPLVAAPPAAAPVQPKPAPVSAPMAAAPVQMTPTPMAAVTAPTGGGGAGGANIPMPQFKPTPVVPGKNDDTGLPNTATPGTTQYIEQRKKNLEAATEIAKSAATRQQEVQGTLITQGNQAALERETNRQRINLETESEAPKASNKIYGEQYAKVPEQKQQAVDTIAAANRLINIANDPEGAKLMSYFYGGNKAASAITQGASALTFGALKPEVFQNLIASTTFTPEQRTKLADIQTDAAKLGIEYTAQMFKGARLGIGLEKLGQQGKGVSPDYTAATNKLYAQITRDNAQFVVDNHNYFRDSWQKQNPGKTWGDYIQSKDYDQKLDQHLAKEQAITSGTPIVIKKFSPDEAVAAAKSSKFDKFIKAR